MVSRRRGWRGAARTLAMLATLAALAALAACAGASGAPGTPGGGTSAHDMGPSPAASATSASATSSPATTTAGASVVRVTPGAARFSAAEPVLITIHNGTGVAIYALANFTDCSVIVLSRSDARGWAPVDLCAGGLPRPSVVPVAPGASLTVELTPAPPAGNTGDLGASGLAAGGWAAGTYRAALTYTTSAGAAFSAGETVTTAPFTVG